MVKARFEKLSGRQDIRVIRYSDTEVVRSAGEVVFVKAHQQGAVVALWRQLSPDPPMIMESGGLVGVS